MNTDEPKRTVRWPSMLAQQGLRQSELRELLVSLKPVLNDALAKASAPGSDAPPGIAEQYTRCLELIDTFPEVDGLNEDHYWLLQRLNMILASWANALGGVAVSLAPFIQASPAIITAQAGDEHKPPTRGPRPRFKRW